MSSYPPVPFALTHENVTVIWLGKPFTAPAGTPQYAGLRDAILREDWESIGEHLTQANSLRRWLADNQANGEGLLFSIVGDGDNAAVAYNGEEIPTRSFVQRMWEMAARGESPAPLLRFYERLQKNPSSRSVLQLWTFLMHTNIPIEADGHFLAYKGVNENLTDCHTGTINNTPGQIVEVKRNKVSDDPNHACHFGLHVGALGYVNGFGSTQMICRIDPEHVVCVPHDASYQKMRVCKYEVVGFASGQPMSSTIADASDLPSSAADSYSDEDADGDDEDNDEVEDEDQDAADHIPDNNDVDHDSGDYYGGSYHAPPEAPPGVHPPRVVGGFPRKKLRKAALDKKDARALLKESIGDLRRYAGKLDVVGASKIPGGKASLVTKILRARRRH